MHCFLLITDSILKANAKQYVQVTNCIALYSNADGAYWPTQAYKGRYLSFLGRQLECAVELSSDVAARTGELRRRRFRPRRDTLPFPRMASRRRTPACASYDGRAPSWGSGRWPTPARIRSSLDRIRRGRRWIRRGRPRFPGGGALPQPTIGAGARTGRRRRFTSHLAEAGPPPR